MTIRPIALCFYLFLILIWIGTGSVIPLIIGAILLAIGTLAASA